MRTLAFRNDFITYLPYHHAALEVYGHTQTAAQLWTQQQMYQRSYARIAPPPGPEPSAWFTINTGPIVDLGMDDFFYAFGPALLSVLAAYGCNASTDDIVSWYEQGVEWSSARTRGKSSQDGKRHTYPADQIKALLQSLVTLASVDTESSGGVDWLETLPKEDAPTLFDCGRGAWTYTMARTRIAEVFEKEARLEDAVRFAQATLADELNFSSPDRVSRFLP